MPFGAAVGVIGLGLIGGSAAKAFRARGYTLYGYDRQPETHRLALGDGTVIGENRWQNWIDEVQTVIVATPLETVGDWLNALARVGRRPQTVVELSSVKGPLLPALSALPERLTPLSLHPMAGSERSGYGESSAGLFQGFPCAVVTVPGRETPLESVDEILEVWGMHPVYIDGKDHDRVVAAVSHLPYLVAAALLVASERAGEDIPQWTRLVGPGFWDTTRVGASNAELFETIVRFNQPQLLPVLDEFLQILGMWRDRLAEGKSIGDLKNDPGRIRARLEKRRPS